MAYHDRTYDVYVILGSPAGQPIWHWQQWILISALFDPFVRAARDKAAVRVHQFNSNTKKSIAFGRTGWNDKGHQKWAHDSPVTEGRSEAWKFLGMEMWAPSWSICTRDDIPPDIFLAYRNERFWKADDAIIKFNPTVLFAVATTVRPDLVVEARRTANVLADYLDAPLRAYQRRAWGKSFGSGAFTDAIQDILYTGLFRVGPIHEKPISLDLFSDEWEWLVPV